jgi:GNAT superfamily N-acetyltransferase
MIHGPGVEQNEKFMRVVTRESHPFGNLAIVSDPDDLASMRAAVSPLLGVDFPGALLYPRGVSDAVRRAILAAGFADHGVMPAMAVDIAHVPATTLPPGYTWTRVGPGAEGSAWTETLALGYGLPRNVANLFSPDTFGADMAADADVQYFSIRHKQQAVATSLLYLADGLAGIYCVATLPEHRGKGLGAYATAEALRAAQRLGYEIAILQSSPMGHSVYRSLGFADCGGVAMFVRLPA